MGREAKNRRNILVLNENFMIAVSFFLKVIHIYVLYKIVSFFYFQHDKKDLLMTNFNLSKFKELEFSCNSNFVLLILLVFIEPVMCWSLQIEHQKELKTKRSRCVLSL